MGLIKRKEKKQSYMFQSELPPEGDVKIDMTDRLALMIAAAQIVIPVILLFVGIFAAVIFVFIKVLK